MATCGGNIVTLYQVRVPSRTTKPDKGVATPTSASSSAVSPAAGSNSTNNHERASQTKGQNPRRNNTYNTFIYFDEIE